MLFFVSLWATRIGDSRITYDRETSNVFTDSPISVNSQKQEEDVCGVYQYVYVSARGEGREASIMVGASRVLHWMAFDSVTWKSPPEGTNLKGAFH